MSINNQELTVIIPCKKKKKTISRTLDSLKKQTDKRFRVIIVDDCSADLVSLENIISCYSNELEIQLFKHEYNKNGAAARNTGISQCKTKFLSFLDSDDVWLPNKVEVVMELIYGNDISIETLFYSQLYLGNDVKPLEECRVYPERGINVNEDVSDYIFLHGGLIQTSTIVCSTEMANTVLFNESFTRHQDFDFVLRCAEKAKDIYFYNTPLVKWVVEDNDELKKGESIAFCDYWLAQMKRFLTRDAQDAYVYFIKAKRYKDCGKISKSILLKFKVFLTSSLRFKKVYVQRVWSKLSNLFSL